MTEDVSQKRTEIPAHRGMEIFEVQPIILGGSSTDPKNKIFVNREEHIKLVRYWNKLIKEMRQRLKPD